MSLIPKTKTGPESGLGILLNSFSLNNLAERVGFEFTRKRSFNNIERTAGNEKQWKAVVSSANGSQTDHGSGITRKAPRKDPKIDVLPRHSLSRKSEPYGLRRSQSSNLRLATIRELMAIKAFTGTDGGLLRSVLGPWSPVPKAHGGHPFQWKNTLPWYLGHAAKVRIRRFKNLPPFRRYRGLQNHV